MAKSLMIVDDSSEMRKIFMRIAKMTQLDINEIQTAGNGNETLEKLSASSVDILLCDINMPEMNGYELVQNIRKLPVCKDMKIILISAENSNDVVSKAIASGADGHITKPFTPNKLREKLLPFVYVN